MRAPVFDWKVPVFDRRVPVIDWKVPELVWLEIARVRLAPLSTSWQAPQATPLEGEGRRQDATADSLGVKSVEHAAPRK